MEAEFCVLKCELLLPYYLHAYSIHDEGNIVNLVYAFKDAN